MILIKSLCCNIIWSMKHADLMIWISDWMRIGVQGHWWAEERRRGALINTRDLKSGGKKPSLQRPGESGGTSHPDARTRIQSLRQEAGVCGADSLWQRGRALMYCYGVGWVEESITGKSTPASCFEAHTCAAAPRPIDLSPLRTGAWDAAIKHLRLSVWDSCLLLYLAFFFLLKCRKCEAGI